MPLRQMEQPSSADLPLQLYSSPIVSFPISMTPPSKSETDGANDVRSRGSVKDAPTTHDDMQVRTIGE